MGLGDQLRRLKREAQKDRVVLRLRGGGVRIFSDLEVFSEMFLCRTDLFMGKARPSEVLDAGRAAFEEEYGSIEMVNHVIAPEHRGGWVDEYRLLGDGTVKITRFEGGSEEARQILEEARRQGPAF